MHCAIYELTFVLFTFYLALDTDYWSLIKILYVFIYLI